MHVDLTDLRLLLAIADAGSLSKAAERFPIALSAASNRLRGFEEDCGIVVFTRSAGGMAPTPAGRFILERAARVVSEVEQLRDTVRELRGPQRGAVRLAGTTVAISTFLPAALGVFLGDHPEVDLQLEERTSRDILQAVRAREIEIGILDGNVATGDVISLPFRTDRLVLLVPNGHPLGARPATRLRDAFEFAFVCLPAERPMQHFVESRAVQSGRPLKVRVRAPSFDAIAQLVAQDAGIAMLPETAASRFARELPVGIVSLDDAWANRELRVCFADPNTLSPHAETLLRYLAHSG
ncbi:LysR family transcriptional regulator [Massilia timonae]|uniref:Bacterial regulatory helix-turn-helix, lysR family protein n=1 Tax=Massilia timonae TaxID=47229 RepID=A0A1S2N6V1_9BURK|nr:LysR family transcriptional regulator [Massilia timonae]OIJ40798.1 bacterial regulatory helix-turn-helix, lysR family protein [Massilia timonae]